MIEDRSLHGKVASAHKCVSDAREQSMTYIVALKMLVLVLRHHPQSGPLTFDWAGAGANAAALVS